MTNNRILFIDAYDSFSNNIISLLKTELGVPIESIKVDDPRFVLNDGAFSNFLDGFDAVVAGPGPGHPAISADVGLIHKLWDQPEEHLLPALGICLGFQSLALAYGATVERLQEPRHGLVTPILHCGRDVFEGTGDVSATQYHSLHARISGHDGQADIANLWRSSTTCRELVPQAWDMSDPGNGPILMAARHCHKPFWGVQYHPESICTNEEGRKLIKTWWREVCDWRLSQPKDPSHVKHIPESPANVNNKETNSSSRSARPGPSRSVRWTSIQLPEMVDTVDVVDQSREGIAGYEPFLLESGMRHGKPVNTETGRFSIIGLHDSSSSHIRYSVETRQLVVVVGCGTQVSTEQFAEVSEVFDFLKGFTEDHEASDGPSEVPFWGGLLGFISYEAGLQSTNVSQPEVEEQHPSVCFVFVERSVIIDHISGTAYVQSVREADTEWVSCTAEKLSRRIEGRERAPKPAPELKGVAKMRYSPRREEYMHKVSACQAHLREGSSYELCLTDTTKVWSASEPWSLYNRLRLLNPAPFGAYLHLAASEATKAASTAGVSLISSSPERFLSWSRDGNCQFRPIKGTVKKTPGMTRARAEELLTCTKERAENLMIVDLIRHDLSGVAGVRNVQVSKLMAVEEYESVFQLVSVISGDLEGASGLDVLAGSLPPGSMTGAPKKRSCELLRDVEGQHPRGLYSGVVGYLDVGGGGDFSVVIRSAFKWTDEAEWRIGAGGAVTALSSPEAEWSEMLAKRENVLRAFDIAV